MRGGIEISFLLVWHDLMEILAISFFIGGIAVYFIYKIRVFRIRGYREKYDFINIYEIRWFKWVFYMFAFSVSMIINMYAADQMIEINLWFFVRFFISVAGATLVGYVASLVLDFHYPTHLDSKLKRWRYEPRISEKSGNTMKIFNEAEDYVRLNHESFARNEIHSMDYDVWIDVGSDDIRIEEYDSRLISHLCRNCNLYTMKVVEEEIVKKIEEETGNEQLYVEDFSENDNFFFDDDLNKKKKKIDKTGDELIRHYRCMYCKNVRATQFYVSIKTEENYRRQKPGIVKHKYNIDAIKIEIRSVMFGKQFYEFDTLDQAQNFLDTYESTL